jgi:hypothetical protein
MLQIKAREGVPKLFGSHRRGARGPRARGVRDHGQTSLACERSPLFVHTFRDSRVDAKTVIVWGGLKLAFQSVVFIRESVTGFVIPADAAMAMLPDVGKAGHVIPACPRQSRENGSDVLFASANDEYDRSYRLVFF